MDVKMINMTGPEFEKLCNYAKREDFDFNDIAAIFGRSDKTLYNWFKLDELPPSVESKIDSHPKLSAAKNQLFSKASPPAVMEQTAIIQTMGEVMKSLLPAMTQSIATAIKDTVSEFSSVVKEQTAAMRQEMDRREKDYEVIRNNNAAILDTNSIIMGQFTNLSNLLMSHQPQHQDRPEFGPKVKK